MQLSMILLRAETSKRKRVVELTATQNKCVFFRYSRLTVAVVLAEDAVEIALHRFGYYPVNV